MEKTQIKDADDAAEEAWKIYEKTGGIIVRDEEGKVAEAKGASSEEIKNEYEVYISLGSDWVHVNVIQDNVNEDIDHEITTIAEGISPSASRAICLAYLQWVESRGKI